VFLTLRQCPRPASQAEVITASDGSLIVTMPIRIKRRGSRKAVTLPDGGAMQPRPWDDTPTPISKRKIKRVLA